MTASAKTPLQNRLFALADPDYKTFHCRLMPTVDPAVVIGVRTPALRQLAKEIKNTPQAADFLKMLPHDYYEENNLHGFLLEYIKDYDDAVAALNAFLPYINNWATCDMTAPKALGKNRPALFNQIQRWICDPHPYTVRYGIGMLMRHFLEDDVYTQKGLALAAGLTSYEYYVNMMIAWYFATALAKQYDAAIPFITRQQLPVFVHNKAIQKAVESRRISPETKNYLRSLKR